MTRDFNALGRSFRGRSTAAKVPHNTNKQSTNNTNQMRTKNYQIDLHSVTLAAVHGRTVEFPEWKYALTIPATRCGKALKRAEKLFPGRTIRARLISGQFSNSNAA